MSAYVDYAPAEESNSMDTYALTAIAHTPIITSTIATSVKRFDEG